MAMEEEEEYLETDMVKLILGKLKHLGVDAQRVSPGKLDIEKPPYYSGMFSGSIFRMVESIGTIKTGGQNFDYVHILRRG